MSCHYEFVWARVQPLEFMRGVLWINASFEEMCDVAARYYFEASDFFACQTVKASLAVG